MPKKYEINNQLNILNESEVVYAARAGINRQKVNEIMHFTGFTLSEMGQYAHVATRTLQRKNPGEKFPADISEKFLLIQNLYVRGSKVFGSLADFQDWMNTPNRIFDNSKPKDFLDTYSGLEYIMQELGRIEHGFFA